MTETKREVVKTNYKQVSNSKIIEAMKIKSINLMSRTHVGKISYIVL